MPTQVAALFVESKGCYTGLNNVDPWDIVRDARQYNGNAPVVAHPPCARWGNYSAGGPACHGRYKTGDDDGCFLSALVSVVRFGGVLEHPARTKAYTHFGIKKPTDKGWSNAGFKNAWVCQVEQGWYGHRAPKPTWLLYVSPQAKPPFELHWGMSPVVPLPTTIYNKRSGKPYSPRHICERLSQKERLATPHEFRDLLIRLALHSQGSATDA